MCQCLHCDVGLTNQLERREQDKLLAVPIAAQSRQSPLMSRAEPYSSSLEGSLDHSLDNIEGVDGKAEAEEVITVPHGAEEVITVRHKVEEVMSLSKELSVESEEEYEAPMDTAHGPLTTSKPSETSAVIPAPSVRAE